MGGMRTWHVSLVLLALGCGGGSGAGSGDAGKPDGTKPMPDTGARESAPMETAGRDTAAKDSATDAPPAYPAPHPAMPQEQNLGGPVMKAPKFVVITFAGDALAGKIDDFSDKVAKSKTYWSGTTKEYGVGPVA